MSPSDAVEQLLILALQFAPIAFGTQNQALDVGGHGPWVLLKALEAQPILLAVAVWCRNMFLGGLCTRFLIRWLRSTSSHITHDCQHYHARQ
jgi:hypothetical protein